MVQCISSSMVIIRVKGWVLVTLPDLARFENRISQNTVSRAPTVPKSCVRLLVIISVHFGMSNPLTGHFCHVTKSVTNLSRAVTNLSRAISPSCHSVTIVEWIEFDWNDVLRLSVSWVINTEYLRADMHRFCSRDKSGDKSGDKFVTDASADQI